LAEAANARWERSMERETKTEADAGIGGWLKKKAMSDQSGRWLRGRCEH